MSARVIARSISRPVGERLRQGPLPPARVLAAFEHACNLVTAEGDVIALVSPQVGDGPLNVVIEGGGGLSAIEPGTPACLGRERLQVGGMEIALHPAATWEPRPDWEKLRLQRATCAHRLPLLRELCLRHASPGSLLDPVPGGANAVASATWATAQSATRHLQAGWQGDTARLQAGASQLAGLGGGLTHRGRFSGRGSAWGMAGPPRTGPAGPPVGRDRRATHDDALGGLFASGRAGRM